MGEPWALPLEHASGSRSLVGIAVPRATHGVR